MPFSSRKQQLFWSVALPMFAQRFEQHLAEHHLAVFEAFTSLDPSVSRNLLVGSVLVCVLALFAVVAMLWRSKSYRKAASSFFI